VRRDCAKRINADLDNAVEQLKNYANVIEDEQEDPFVCVATNGINWRIYVYNPKNNSEIDLFLVFSRKNITKNNKIFN